MKRHSCTASDRFQKKAASTFPTNLSYKTTSIVHHQSYFEHIALLKIADDILVVRMQRCLARFLDPMGPSLGFLKNDEFVRFAILL